MKPIFRYLGDFRWDGVPVEAYKSEGAHFREVTRQLLFGRDAGLATELRYFEIGARGYTTLERHQHTHAVMIVRGAGSALVGSEIFELRPFDLVRVPPMTWHQLRSSAEDALGFLCLVDADRDRPLRPTDGELEALRRQPEVAAFIRI